MRNIHFLLRMIPVITAVFINTQLLQAGENALVDSWDVEIIKKSTNEIVKAETVETNSYLLEGLENNVEYFARVRTRNTFLSDWETSEAFVYASLASLLPVELPNLFFRSADGLLFVSSEIVRPVQIHAIDGRLLRSVLLLRGENMISGLDKGLYLIANQKVVIK